MSDVSIQFPWWFSGLLLIGLAFWPLTLAAAAAGSWLWLRRSRLVVRIVTIPVFILWLVSASVNLYGWIDNWRSETRDAAELQSRKHTLTESTQIAGITLPPKTVVTRKYGEGPESIESLDLVEPADVHGVPLIGHVEFDDAGRIDGIVTLARDTTIARVPCSAKGDVMLLNGTLSTCTLAREYAVHGIPCAGKLDITVGVACALATPYVRFGVVWPPQTFINDSPPQGRTWITTGPNAPSLRVFGSALPEKTGIDYVDGKLARINLGARVVHFRGDAINVIDVNGNALQGEIARADVNDSVRHVTLPASAIQLR